jgi:predicted enzyme related to lactoylglutathione lyase
MAERTSYAPGTPSWVDMGSPDPQAAARFYGDLLGWTVDFDERPEAGGYALARLRGKNVAGLGPSQNPGAPPFWSVYVSVVSADDALASASANGATVVVPAMDVLDAGRMGVLQDPLGTFVSVWQPGATIGAELVNEPGTFGWNELATTDLAASTAFYTATFGWGVHPESTEGGTIFAIDGEMVCGAHQAGEGEFPAWSVWFTVQDCDAAAARVTELGGSVMMPPNDMEFGRGAVVADPQGAVFGLAALNEPAA